MTNSPASLDEALAAQLAVGVAPGADDGDHQDRRQSAVLALVRRAIVSPNVSLLMQDAVNLLIETLGADAGAVAELTADGESLERRLSLAKAAAKPAKPVVEKCSLEPETSLAAYALSMAQPILVENLEREQRFRDKFLTSHKVASALACPMTVPDRSYGVLAVYRTHPQPFDRQDLLFLETITHLVTTTIARERAEVTLSETERFTSALWDAVDTLVMVVSADGQIERVNPTCLEISGFEETELVGRALAEAFFSAEEIPLVESTFRRARQGKKNAGCETGLMTKQGERRCIDWSLAPLKDAQGKVSSVLISGMDVTQQRTVESKLTALINEKPSEDGAKKQNAPNITMLDGAQPGDTESEKGAERRTRPRRAYPYIQSIAPMIDGKLPPKSAFRDVRCRDISAGGFSFIVPRPPAEEFFVVAFGAGEALTYIVAQAVHTNRIVRDGVTMYVVGCHYTSRAAY